MKGIYLASYKAHHPDYNIIYQDIDGRRDLGGDMMDINLADYDFIIATPPCNWWSRESRQGGEDVHQVIERWLNTIHKGEIK